MVLRYRGGNFPKLIRDHKNFIWFVYDEFQLKKSNVSLKPTWVDDNNVIKTFTDSFPNVIFVESLYSEVIEEIYELGYQLSLDQTEGGLWDSNNDHRRPLIVGFKNGWKYSDSIGKCYCLQTLSDILFEIHPDELLGYLNQPV